LSLYSSEKIKAHVRQRLEKLAAEKSPTFNHNRVVTRVIQDYVGEGKVRDHVFTTDEPPERGGTDKGPSPLEYFVAGFSFCQQAILIQNAARMGIELDSVEIDADGIVPSKGPYGAKDSKPGIIEIKYKLKLQSKESKEKIMRLIETMENYCPAVNTLKNPPVLSCEIVLNGEAIK